MPFKKSFVFNGYGNDVGDGGDELHLAVHVVFLFETADEHIRDGQLFVLYRNDHIELADERIVVVFHVFEAGVAGQQRADVYFQQLVGYADGAGTAPVFIVFMHIEGHFFDAEFPAQKRLVHFVQPLCRHVVVDGLGNAEQPVDLQLLEIQLALQRFHIRETFFYF